MAIGFERRPLRAVEEQVHQVAMLSHKRQIHLSGLLDILRSVPLKHIVARERMIRLQQPLHFSRKGLYHGNKESILAREVVVEVA